MAGRPPKESIDYAGWAVDIFDNDNKIDKLLDAQGASGFLVYFYLCQRAYGSKGYFYAWGFDDAATTARKIGGGVGSGTVIETVKLCFRIGLFDEGLFDRCGILTSRGIQKRYWQVAKDRNCNTVNPDYWLLEKPDGLDSHIQNVDYNPSKSNYAPPKLNNEALKESKAKKSKGKGNRRFTPPTLEQVQAYCIERNNTVDPKRFFDYYEATGWKDQAGKPVRSWKGKVITWEGNSGGKPQQAKPDYTDTNRYKNLSMDV